MERKKVLKKLSEEHIFFKGLFLEGGNFYFIEKKKWGGGQNPELST
jgi:hypothetical protein